MKKVVKFRHTMRSRNCPTNNSVCKVSKVGDCRWVIFSSGGAPYDVYKRKYVVDYYLSGKHQKDALLCILGGLSLMRLPHSVLYHLFLFPFTDSFTNLLKAWKFCRIPESIVASWKRKQLYFLYDNFKFESDQVSWKLLGN